MRAKYLSYEKKNDPTEISEVLGRLIEKASVRIDVRQGELIQRWSEIAPSDWSEVATPIGIRERTLLVEVQSGTAASLLKYQKQQLLGAIVDAFGNDLVSAVRIRVSR
ncbi:MAG: DUF721 domain-containing protein [Acidimicrobiia bacterium]